MAEREPRGGDLDERLRRFREERDGGAGRAGGAASMHGGVGFAMRIGVELVAALAAGTGLGWLLDRWLGTLPLLSLAGFLLGAAAGMLNVYRAATRKGGD